MRDKFNQIYFEDPEDIIEAIMTGNRNKPGPFLIKDHSAESFNELLDYEAVQEYTKFDGSVKEFDKANQKEWFMPDEYKEMDIAKIILDSCDGEVELQRCGKELLMYAERDLMDLLRYLKYLVDTMKSNHIIWGVGRGSSVSSFVLYKLGVHKINSLYYGLEVEEFLR